MFITRKDGAELRIEKGHKAFLHNGDTFTLCGQHFPFLFSSKVSKKEQNQDSLNESKENMDDISMKESSEYSPDFFARSKSNGDEIVSASSLITPVKKDPNKEIPKHGSFLSPKGHQDPNLRTEDDKVILGTALIGKSVRQYFSLEKYSPGVITNYNPETDEYEIIQSTGEKSWNNTNALVFIEKESIVDDTKKRKKEKEALKSRKIRREEDGVTIRESKAE